mgnify:CR=1 FL=1
MEQFSAKFDISSNKATMIRNILFLFLFFALALSQVFAQNLSLSDSNGPVANNATIQVWGDSGYYNIIYANVAVTNNSGAAMDVLVKKTEINVTTGSENLFCWGTCYLPSTFVSTTSINIGAGATDTLSFAGEYKPLGQLGATTIRYTFYNLTNVNDSVSVYVVYNAGTAAIEKMPVIVDFSNAYPNPASSVVNFNYELQSIGSAELIITDLLGSEISRTVLSNDKSKLSIDVSTYNAGVYFYSLRVDGKQYFTRKLIVRK